MTTETGTEYYSRVLKDASAELSDRCEELARWAEWLLQLARDVRAGKPGAAAELGRMAITRPYGGHFVQCGVSAILGAVQDRAMALEALADPAPVITRAVYDNGELGDSHFRLEEDEDGLLYETSNAVTRAIVCGKMFAGWGNLRSEEWRRELIAQFGGSEVVADRYIRAALDDDK